LQDIVEPLARLNTTLVALTPQVPSHSLKMIESHKLGFDILSDPGNAYAAQLGLRFEIPPEIKEIYLGFGIDLPACNGEPSWTLPMPGRVIVDRQGVVRAVDVDPDYTVRPEPQRTLEQVQALGG
jgi:peroxiredoxin